MSHLDKMTAFLEWDGYSEEEIKMRMFQKIAHGDIVNHELRDIEIKELRDELSEVEEAVTFIKIGLREAIEHMYEYARDAKRANDTTTAFALNEEIKFLGRIAKVAESLQYDEPIEQPVHPRSEAGIVKI